MKQILLLAGALMIFVGSNAQKKIEDNGDSLHILGLQQQLKTVNGVKEVDLLNAIAWEYAWYGSDKTPSYNYAALAKRKADSMGYEKGVGYASFLLAHKYVQSDKNTADSMFKVALTIGEKLDDSRLLGWCYYQQWDQIDKYVRGEGGYLIMSDASKVDVSRSRKELLLQKLLPSKY